MLIHLPCSCCHLAHDRSRPLPPASLTWPQSREAVDSFKAITASLTDKYPRQSCRRDEDGDQSGRFSKRQQRQPPYTKPEGSTHQGKKAQPASFQTSSSPPLSVCAVCLSRHKHHVGSCNASTIWSGGQPFSKRDHAGKLVNLEGHRLCLDFQRPRGCSSTQDSHRHECSGCGKKDHGANDCPRAQKA